MARLAPVSRGVRRIRELHNGQARGPWLAEGVSDQWLEAVRVSADGWVSDPTAEKTASGWSMRLHSLCTVRLPRAWRVHRRVARNASATTCSATAPGDTTPATAPAPPESALG